jgi:hypothetical protein
MLTEPFKDAREKPQLPGRFWGAGCRDTGKSAGGIRMPL